MDVSFVNPNTEAVGLNDATVEPPLGLAYMAAMLEKNGYRSEIVDANVYGLTPAKCVDKINRKVRVVGIYIDSFCYKSASEIVEIVKKRLPEAIIILGGPVASAIPETVLKDVQCHGIIQGEGEYAILRVVNNIFNGRQPFDEEVSGAVYFDTNGELVSNPVHRIRDLDQLPHPAIHLLPPLNTYRSRSLRKPVAPMITSRGCAHHCIFCSKDVFQNRVTLRSAKNVLHEIDLLVRRYGVKQIDILDDNFLHRKERVIEIAEGLIKRKYNLAINLQSGIRTEKLDNEVLEKMREAGFYKLGFGIESADPNVLKACRKHLDLTKVKWAIKTAKNLGYEVYGFFIIGLPGETEKSFQKTIKFACRSGIDVANFTIAIPFVGTQLYNMIKEEGRFLVDTRKNINTGFYGRTVFFEYGENRKEDVLRRFNTAYKEFYSIKKKIHLLLKARSLGEIFWTWNAAMVVLKGFLREQKLRSI